MLRNAMTKAALTAALAIGAGTAGLAVFPGIAQAANVQVSVDGRVTAQSYGANGAVQVCDTSKDGDAVYTKYERRSGASGRLEERNGDGTCLATPNTPSDPITKFDACIDRPDQSDLCSAYYYTDR